LYSIIANVAQVRRAAQITCYISLMHRLPPLILLALLLPAPSLADLDTSRLRANPSPSREQGSAGTDDAQAQFKLAVRYANGDGVPADPERALRIFTRAAEQGHAESAASLGVMYSEGQGVKVDPEQALHWSQRGAALGSVRAKYSLGLAYYHGNGVERDFAAALRWYHEAADAGYAPAMNNLGIMYGLGEGVPRDDARAYAWFITSASRGNENAEKNRDLTRAELGEQARAEGEALAESLQARLP
jgi:TPR repeat protein